MDIDEAAVVVQGPRSARWNAAAQAITQFLEEAAKREGASADDAEDVAQTIVIRLLTRLQSGDVPWGAGCHRAYLKAGARNAVFDLRRQSARQSAHELPEVATAEPEQDPSELLQPALALLEQVADCARERRAPRYREDFDRVWHQLRRLVLEGQPLRALLEAEGSITPRANEAEWIQARNRAYTAHKRVREEMLAAVEHLVQVGALASEPAELVLQAMKVFVRCQRRAVPRVSVEKRLSP